MNKQASSRRDFLKFIGFSAVSAMLIGKGVSRCAESAGANKPDILLILADDCTYNDLAVYGGQNAVTVNIDRLVSEGLVFNRAYLSSAMCQPHRIPQFSDVSALSCRVVHRAIPDAERLCVELFGESAQCQKYAGSSQGTGLSCRSCR